MQSDEEDYPNWQPIPDREPPIKGIPATTILSDRLTTPFLMLVCQ